MPTVKDEAQKEKDEMFRQIRHMTNLCTCPSYITITELNYILSVLKGEK
jgi:hypothetical protein